MGDLNKYPKSWLCKIGLHKWIRGTTGYVDRCGRKDCEAKRTNDDYNDYY